MAAVEAVVIGAGNRGRFTYGAFARANPELLRVVALAEPNEERRSATAAEHGLGRDRAWSGWAELFERPQLAPVAIIATGDTQHVEPALAALARGYHVLLEKPIAPEAADCVRVVRAAERAGRILQIGHVLRYTPFYTKVHEILESGRLGRIIAVDMKEHVAYWHMTHSYVRGKFRNRSIAAPIVLAKTCHDLDLLAWFVESPAARVASFGSLSHFRESDAPAGAPERCADGCPVQERCLHDAVRFYTGPDDRTAQLWPWTDVSLDPSRAARRRALETGPYGRCVYRCDNDVPDHQVLVVEFESGVTATFTMQGLASEERRTIRITGTLGELRGVFQEGVIEVSRHGALDRERHSTGGSIFGHFGGDDGLLRHFVEVIARGALGEIRTSGRISLESHLLGFAAEESRTAGRVVEMAAFRQRAERTAGAGPGA
ncbi:MAG TPA: Gfo/Idh/MocA family oxidoreductase [Myxococcota bacterium]|nr:Gfo/Idh/MocA family oxidoreductase [Myxococcota bacterium]